MAERIPPPEDPINMMLNGALNMRASFHSPSFTQDQVVEIGKFFRTCGIASKKLKKLEWIDGRIHKIRADMPGYEIQIYCGMMGESVDVVLEDESRTIAWSHDVNIIYEKLRERARRRTVLTQLGFARRDCGPCSADTMTRPDPEEKGEAYTKVVATHHTDTLISELDKIREAMA